MLLSTKDYMLCWDPHTDRVALLRHPWRGGRPFPYRCDALASNSAVHRMTFQQRKALVFIEAYHLIVADGCDPAAVHRALWPLEEYRAGLAEDFPEPGEPLRWMRRNGSVIGATDCPTDEEVA